MTCRIAYNTNRYIYMLMDRDGVVPEGLQDYKRNISGSGLTEQINLYGMESYKVRVYFDAETWQQLYTFWWSWARTGGVFSFAEDMNQVTSTTLDEAAAAGQPVIPLTATNGFAVGEDGLIIAAGDAERETVTIESISGGASVTATRNLDAAFIAGAAFRHAGYYPSLQLDMKTFPRSKRTGIEGTDNPFHYEMTLKFKEYLT